jgi:hypothetical protein
MPIGRERDAVKPFMRLSLILTLTMAVATLTASASPSLTVGAVQQLYSDAQMPFTMDGSFATLKRDASTMYFFHSLGPQNFKYFGPLNNPLQTLVWQKSLGAMWPTWGSRPGVPWLYNIYRVDATHLLGFIHHEFTNPFGPPYAIGLGYSSDNCDTWTYLGDVLKSQFDGLHTDDTSFNGNMGGVPYLKVGPYFYIYYMEVLPDANGSHVGPSAARALVSEVLAAAAAGTTSTWMKYTGGGTWNANAFTGLGTAMFPATQWEDNRHLDAHTDAAHSTALNKYMIMFSNDNRGKLILFLSDDGVNWPASDAILLNTTDGSNGQPVRPATGGGFMNQAYATFASLDPEASDDSLEVGANFTVYIPYKDWPNVYNYDELYRRQVTVGSPSMPAAPRSLQLSSLLRTAWQRLTAWLVTALALASPAPAEAVTFWT